jgi:trk system potassium uptake protein TrkA
MGAQTEFVDATSSLCLAEVHIGEPWLGKTASDLADATTGRVAFLTRYGQALLPDDRTVIQEGDLVHLLFDPDRRDDVERICEKGR